MIIGNYSLAVIILKELIKLGKRSNTFEFNQTFSEEELDSITEITITNCDGLEGISKLKNLKKLNILGPRLDSFEEKLPLNHIKNFDEINKLVSLETLSIVNDYNIKTLNIDDLNNLKYLRLFNNPNLKRIKGLDKKTEIKKIMICYCHIENIGDLKKYIENTKNASVNILDLLFSIDMLKDSKIRELLKERYNSGFSNIRFGEHIYFYDEVYTNDIYQVIDMYHRASKILKDLNIDSLRENDKVFAIYNYIIKNLNYDYDGLKFRDNNYIDSLNLETDEKKYILRRMAVINSSFGAFTKRKVVCDGYVNMMKYLLARCGINSQTVVCKNNNSSIHAAIKYFINGVWYYADPERDQNSKTIKYFNLTKEEFSKIYILSPKENFDEMRIKEVNEHGRSTTKLHK